MWDWGCRIKDAGMNFERLFVLLLLLGLVACSNSGTGSPQGVSETNIKPDTLSGMKLISATNSAVVLGTDNAQARNNERPEMKAKFGYDFFIGRHEVTCAEFDSLMHPFMGLALACENGNIPATNVSFYDIVLFANERSKSENFDTAYTYSSIKFDSEGHCSGLEGYAFHPEVNAYRIPTEAEWVLAANAGWNPAKGWNAENSDYQLHEVCSATGNDEGLCDMAGNAMEWVNDWMGLFRDTTVTNYVGVPDGGSIGERVVKGGSYRNLAASVTLYGRGDIYTVTSSTRADYVGFRLAFGRIPDAVWMDRNGMVKTSQIVPIANSSTLRALTRTYKMKLAFRNDVTGNLAYKDYLNGAMSVVEIADTLDVYHPEISPDGEKVAFCTGLEGVSGKSALYVRDLNAEGTNLVKLDVERAAIPRWRVLENGDTVIVYVSDAGNNMDDAAFRATSTWQVRFANGAFGKPEKLFNGAYHDGISEDGTLAVSGARLLRARVADSGLNVMANARDTVWYDSAQACNASLAKDGSKRTLFLDFGGKAGRKYVGEDYGTHERLLVVDSTGKLVQSVASPAGYFFDHSEWVSGRNLAVATLTNAGGAHQKIVLVNFADSSVIDLLEGNELWHPSLWAKAVVLPDDGSLLDLDSAGAYLSDNDELDQGRFRIKLEKFWKRLGVTKVFLAGSSRMEMGVNPELYPEWEMLNFGVTNIEPSRDFYFIKNYALNHPQNLKAIAVSIDLDGWHCADNRLALAFLGGPGYVYDANHGFWKDGVPKGFVEAVENAFPASFEETNSFSERGGLYPPSRGWGAEAIEVLMDSVFSEKENACLDARIDDLMDIVDIASEKGVYVIGIIFPQAPQYRNTGSFGLYGLQRSVAPKKIARLDSLAKAKPNFVLMDENKMGNHDYTDEMAQNRDHLSYKGAEQMTSRLVSVLDTLK